MLCPTSAGSASQDQEGDNAVEREEVLVVPMNTIRITVQMMNMGIMATTKTMMLRHVVELQAHRHQMILRLAEVRQWLQLYQSMKHC